jgi:hypothetical protein
MIAKDIDNLMMAGRNVSVTHAALGTVRVMSTTALMGQAAGLAAAAAQRQGTNVSQLPAETVRQVQQSLLRDGCFLPNVRNEDPADLARQAAVTASSETQVAGAGPDSRGFHEGLAVWRDQNHQTVHDRLTHRRAQWIAVSGGSINKLSVCVSNDSGQMQTVQAALLPVEHIWDYRTDPGAPLSETVLSVPPGENIWVEWPVGLTAENGLPENGYVRLDLWANDHVSWHKANSLEPGHMSAFEIGLGKMRRYDNGVTLSFKVEPPQSVYGAANVLSGVTRPHRSTNLWRSDPAQQLPQWLELSWTEEQTIRSVELTFPGHLIREYHAYSPFYRDSQCAKDYTLEAFGENGWLEVLSVRDNYQRHRRHKLPVAVHTAKLRLVIQSTNGDPSAAVYEIRCYGDEGE